MSPGRPSPADAFDDRLAGLRAAVDQLGAVLELIEAGKIEKTALGMRGWNTVAPGVKRRHGDIRGELLCLAQVRQREARRPRRTPGRARSCLGGRRRPGARRSRTASSRGDPNLGGDEPPDERGHPARYTFGCLTRQERGE
jgi:hypothetical protein